MLTVHIGIFAHNEERTIAATLRDFLGQDIFNNPAFTVELFVLANGCSDQTAHIAETVISEGSHQSACVIQYEQPGKSRTWNAFMADRRTNGPAFIFFADADIRLPDPALLGRMIGLALEHPDAHIIASRAIKDMTIDPARVKGPIQKLISAGTRHASDRRIGISGSLYLARTKALEKIYLPVGLPVEDGFLGAMIFTDLLTRDQNQDRIIGRATCWHQYEAVTGIVELSHHQIRLVIGSAINTMLFRYISEKAKDVAASSQLLKQISEDERYIKSLISTQLPIWPYGYIPFRLIYKRIIHYKFSEIFERPYNILMAPIILSYDFLIYIIATYMIIRGKGPGFW